MISSPSPSASEGFLARRARLRRIAARFDCAFSTRCYIIGKLATDPAYGAVFRHFGESDLPLVDIGCGLGLLAHYLRDHGCNAPIYGYDLDTKKIRHAHAAATLADLRDVHFEVGDVSALPSLTANFVLLDVLHYLEPDSRQNLLLTLADRIRHGTRLLMRSAVRDRSWRYSFTAAQECWTRWSGWIPTPAGATFPTLEEILNPFERAGCICHVQPLWGRTPFNGRLITVEPPQEA